LKLSLFWHVRRRRLVTVSERFGTAYLSLLQDYSSPNKNAGSKWMRYYSGYVVGGDWSSEYQPTLRNMSEERRPPTTAWRKPEISQDPSLVP